MGFLQAEVQVPEDASVLDMVFSDSGTTSGGFFDSNHGLGYHVPIRGSRVPQPSLSICHISVEMAPIAKVRLAWSYVCGLCFLTPGMKLKLEKTIFWCSFDTGFFAVAKDSLDAQCVCTACLFLQLDASKLVRLKAMASRLQMQAH